jgi:hypothetical protein
MLLFPHEEKLYIGQEDWMTIIPSPLMHLGKPVPLFYCTKPCPRDMRPLACMVFPLAATMRKGRLSIKMDIRANAVCPLIASGMQGLSSSFVSAVTDAFTALCAVPEYAQYLSTLDRHIRQYRFL